MRRCLVLTMLLWLIASSGSAQQNLLVNGSFETAYKEPGPPGDLALPVGWRRYSFAAGNEASFVDSTGHPQLVVDGTQYLQLGKSNALVQTTTQTITAGTTYNIAAFASTYGYPTAPSVSVYALANRGDVVDFGTLQATLPFAGGSTTMTELSSQFTPAASDVGKYLGVYIAANSDYYAFDNVRLTVVPPAVAIPEPTTAAMLGACGALFALIGRRKAIRVA